MKKLYNLFFVLLVPALVFLLTSVVMYPTGSPGGKTGSPGDGFANCTECHTGMPAVEEDFWIYGPNLTLGGYTTGETYDMFVIAVKEDAEAFGFEATAEDSEGNKVGTFAAGLDTRTQTINNSQAITHTLLGTTPLADTGTVWNFTWTAPAEDVGEIGFYAAINTANGNGLSSGDEIHLSSFLVPSNNIGTEEIAAPSSLIAYPNPTSGTISIERNERSDENLSILNASGQVVFSEQMKSEKIQVDLSEHQKGIYFIRMGETSEKILLR